MHQEGGGMAASVLMTWTPHQERFPHSIDGNGTENGQLLDSNHFYLHSIEKNRS